MQEEMREIHTANNPFWIELIFPNPHDLHPTIRDIVTEDIMPHPDDEATVDDSDVSLQDIIVATYQDLPIPKKHRHHISTHENGGLMTATNVEDINQTVSIQVEEEGRGKWKRKVNMLYCLGDFKQHWDNEVSDFE
jgi:hypothetical protein